ncbi:hypothetical protein HKX48_003542 [Thoreauomyces humboldtii]|nr:hypothetical protein HKX48_003542 [Thoreauomyces humboldtii]
MKKAGSSSKDRLAKSGNAKKRTSSAGGGQQANSGGPQAAGGGTGGGASSALIEEAQDAPVVIWPEWSDAEVAAEKWAGKHVFEDPEGLVWLPRSLRGLVDSHKRPSEMAPEGQTPICIQPLHLEDDMFHSSTPSSAGSMGFGPLYMSPGLSYMSKPSTVDGSPNVGALPEVPTDSADVGDHAGLPVMHGEARDEADGGGPIASTSIAATSALASPDEKHRVEPFSKPQTASEGPKAQDEEASMQLPKFVEEETSDQELLSGTSKLFQTNKHLLPSELMRTILCTLHFLYDQTKQARAAGQANASPGIVPDDFSPWDHIYPKAKDGLPTYNLSGKYIIKLFWLGAWRKVTVDDRIPIDAEGKPLLIASPVAHEIWSLLLTKALLKVVASSYKDVDSACESGDFDVFHTLKGWLPEKLIVDGKPGPQIWNVVASLNLRAFPAGGALAPAPGASSRTSVSQSGPNQQSKGGNTSQGDRSNMTSAQSTRAGAGGGLSAMTTAAKSSSYVVVLAWREGEDSPEKLDLVNMSCPFRVMDIRDSGGSSNPHGGSQRLIRLRSYLSCGYRTRKPGDGKANTKILEEASEAASEATDYWMPFNEFSRTFRFITVYHNQNAFKFVKSITNIPDPIKGNDFLRIPQVIYLTDPTKHLPVFVSLSTYGRVKGDTTVQISSVLVEEYDWKGQGERNCVLRMATNAALTSYLRIPAGNQAYRFIINCPTSYSLSIWARDEFLLEEEGKYMAEKLDLHVRDIDETFTAQPANSWFLFVKNVVRFTQPTFMSASIYVPEYLQSTACLRVIDNDTGQEIPLVFYILRPRTYLPNKNGYTFVADCRTTQSKPGGKWKLRYVTETAPVVPPERPLELWTKPIVQDFDDVCTPNKHNILFRQVVRVKDAPTNCVSMQLTFSFPTAWLKLQVFDNDVEIHCARGKGVATVHVLNLVQTDDPQAPPPVVKPVEKAEKKGKDGGKESREAAKDPVGVAVPVSELPALPKHRYIIQGTVEQVELSKLVGMLSATPSLIGEANRPQSRGPKAPAPTASAKKKRSATVSSGSGAAPPANLAPSSAKEAPANMGGSTGSDDRPPASELTWHLRIISTDSASLAVARDTEKEDRYRAVKDSWETTQAGRAARAREARDLYLKQVETGMIHPIVITGIGGANVPYKPWTIHGSRAATELARRRVNSVRESHSSVSRENNNMSSSGNAMATDGRSTSMVFAAADDVTTSVTRAVSAGSRPTTARSSRPASALTEVPRVLSAEEVAARDEERERRHREHEQYQETVRKLRSQDRERRSHTRQTYLDKLEEKARQVEGCKDVDMGRREAYRQKVTREFQELQAKALAAMEAAARESALAAEMSAETEAAPPATSDKDKAKKRGTGKR